MRRLAAAGDTRWGTVQADVTAVRVSADPRSLVLTLALLGTGDGCEVTLTVAGSTEAGCARVTNVESAFPKRLCADLPTP